MRRRSRRGCGSLLANRCAVFNVELAGGASLLKYQLAGMVSEPLKIGTEPEESEKKIDAYGHEKNKRKYGERF